LNSEYQGFSKPNRNNCGRRHGPRAQFQRARTTEKKVGEVLASLERLGYVTSDDGRIFALRRVASLIAGKTDWSRRRNPPLEVTSDH